MSRRANFGRGRSRSIGMVVMDIANPFYTDLVLGAENCVQKRGYSVQVGNSSQEADRESTQLLGADATAGSWGLARADLGHRRAGQAAQSYAGSRSCFWTEPGTMQTSALCRSMTLRVAGSPYSICLIRVTRRSLLIGGPENLQQVADRRLGAELARSRHNGGLARLLVKSTPHLDVASGVTAAEEICHYAGRRAANCSICDE